MTDAAPFAGKALQALQLPPARIKAYEGSVRSGKTFTSLVEWIGYVRTGPPGLLLMAGKTERTILNNLIHPLQEMLGRRRVVINRGMGTVSLLGRTVLLVGANNETSRTKIQGLTLAGAYVDETSTLPETFFNMLVSRLSVPGARLWVTSNPEGPAHWLKIRWLDRARLWIDRDGVEHTRADYDPQRDPDLVRVSWKLEDNEHLDPTYVRETKASYVGMFFRRYVLGEWVASEGAVFDFWDPATHVIAHDDLPSIARHIALGVDHGMTNPSAAVLVGIGTDGNLYALDEWWCATPVNSAKPTVEQQSAMLRGWLAARGVKPEWIPVDPAAEAFRTQLWADGERRIMPAENAVTYGIAVVSSLLGTGRLRISDRCVNLITEIPSYSWDDKAAARGEDKPVKLNDHAVDALRYALASTESMWQNAIRRAA